MGKEWMEMRGEDRRVRIYGFVNGVTASGVYNVVALSEYGVILVNKYIPDWDAARISLGLGETLLVQGEGKQPLHGLYNSCYGMDGWELIWVHSPDNHIPLQEAMDLNRRLSQYEVEHPTGRLRESGPEMQNIPIPKQGIDPSKGIDLGQESRDTVFPSPGPPTPNPEVTIRDPIKDPRVGDVVKAVRRDWREIYEHYQADWGHAITVEAICGNLIAVSGIPETTPERRPYITWLPRDLWCAEDDVTGWWEVVHAAE